MLLTEDIFITRNGKTIAKVVNPNVSAVDAISGILAGKLPDDFDAKELREGRLEKYEFYVNKAIILAETNDYDGALATFKEAGAINSNDSEIYCNMALLHHLIENGILEEYIKKLFLLILVQIRKGGKMRNLFHTFEKMKYISAKLYLLQGKKYSVVETENNFYFGRQNGDILEILTAFSRDVYFICNDAHTNAYAIEIDEEQLKVTVLPEQDKHLFELSGTDEFVIGQAGGNHALLVKTCQNLSNDSQKINMYYINTKTDRIVFCNDNILNESYHMPYVSICDNEEYILAESAVICPYEIDEARKNTSFIYQNDILAVSLRSFMEAISKNEEIKWNVIRSAKEGYYVNILQVNGSHIWFLETTVDETKTNIVKYDLSNGLTEINLCVENRIDKAVFNEDKLLYMYKWNSSKEMIDIYNDQGDFIFKLDYSILTNENDEIELNEILSILDERYVIFHVADYSEDESYQCRVVYDITNNQFMIYNNSYIEYEGWIY